MFVLVPLVTSGEARGEGLAADAEPPVARPRRLARPRSYSRQAPQLSQNNPSLVSPACALETLLASGPSRRCSQSQFLSLDLRARDASIFERATRSAVLGGFGVILNVYDIIFNGTAQRRTYAKQLFVHLDC